MVKQLGSSAVNKSGSNSRQHIATLKTTLETERAHLLVGTTPDWVVGWAGLLEAVGEHACAKGVGHPAWLTVLEAKAVDELEASLGRSRPAGAGAQRRRA